MSFKPKSEALAFRIWAHARALGWNCSIAELAEALNENINRVRAIVVHKKWTNRLRVSEKFVSREIDTRRNYLATEVASQTNSVHFDVEHGLSI